MNGARHGRSGRGRGARTARLALVALVVLVALGLAFWGGMRLERFLEVDRCLDAGGRFDHRRGWCER
ncbi:MAG TPA: hypothetical protein VFZ01_00075 [Geminicoccaceae bacterium]